MTQVYSGLGGSEKARGPGDVWGGVEEAQASHLGATSPQILIKAMERGALPEDRRDPRNILEEHPHGVKVGMGQEQPEAGRSTWRVCLRHGTGFGAT